MEQQNAGLPDWVSGELNDDSLDYSPLKGRPSSTPVTARHRYSVTPLEKRSIALPLQISLQNIAMANHLFIFLNLPSQIYSDIQNPNT